MTHATYKGLVIPFTRVTPNKIDHLAYNEVFVFGSNVYGHHDGGAARAALHKFGAVYGQAEGLQGKAMQSLQLEAKAWLGCMYIV